MKKLFGFGVVVLAAALVAGSASAALTGDESKCELTASKTVAKFAGKKVKCLNKCWSHLRKGDPAICEPAGSRDVDTQGCIDEAEAKSNAGQLKKCTADCPECYSGGDCTADASSKTATAESLIDTQDSGSAAVHCNGGTVSKDQGKCQDNAAKTLTKAVAALSKCTQKCRKNEEKGKVPPGSCTPPASDPKTSDCVTNAVNKCKIGVNKKCVGAATPACWAPPFNDGDGWCNLVKGIVDGQYNSYFCSSPSGAFLE